MKKIMSIDAESNGLWGQIFAIAAVVYDNGKKANSFIGRCPIEGEIDSWVASNVLPKMEGIPVSYEDYDSMLKAFIRFYMENKEHADVIVHVGMPIEASIFIDAHNKGFIGDWDAPFPLIDISAFPEIGASVDAYITKHGITLPVVDGGTHNPLYDCIVAAEAYIHILSSYEK